MNTKTTDEQKADEPTAFAKYRALYLASREAARERLRKTKEMRRRVRRLERTTGGSDKSDYRE